MKNLVALLVICSMPLVLNAGETQYVSFDQIDNIIRTNNPIAQSMESKKEAKKIREGHLARSFLPDLTAEVSQESFKLGSDEQKSQPAWRVEASVNIFRGGADSQEDKVRGMESKSSELEARLATRGQLENAYELYWNLAFRQGLLQTLKSHLSLSEKNLREANRRISSGVTTSTDRLEFEMKISLIRQEIGLAEKDIRRLSSLLGNVLGYSNAVLPQGELQHFHDWEKNFPRVKATDLPEVNLVSSEKEVLDSKRSQLRSDYVPAVDVYAGYAEPNQRDERDFSSAAERRESYFGVKASWSLGKAIDSGVERGSLQKEAVAKGMQLDYLIKHSEITQANKWDEVKVLHSFVHDAEENIKESNKYLDATLKEYERGVKNSPDVLEATEKYIAAKVRHAEIIRDFNLLYSSQLALNAP